MLSIRENVAEQWTYVNSWPQALCSFISLPNYWLSITKDLIHSPHIGSQSWSWLVNLGRGRGSGKGRGRKGKVWSSIPQPPAAFRLNWSSAGWHLFHPHATVGHRAVATLEHTLEYTQPTPPQDIQPQAADGLERHESSRVKLDACNLSWAWLSTTPAPMTVRSCR